MTVYVGEMVAAPRTRAWKYASGCVMAADSVAELHHMARQVGAPAAWLREGRYMYYLLTAPRRRQALTHGAVSVSSAEARRRAGVMPR